MGLEGAWLPSGVHSKLLFAKYVDGEHFGPHTDGCTVVDFNNRSFYPLIIYLNTPTEGGGTRLVSDEQKNQPFHLDSENRYTTNTEYILKEIPAIVILFLKQREIC
eukprot:GHVL01006208.1.p1 GENE.GHVL01006208.1~~GHVL01006208.1.p1  ORF type:complete len:106 (-),score=19.66 GHVL01006208.1:78-395(-)